MSNSFEEALFYPSGSQQYIVQCLILHSSRLYVLNKEAATESENSYAKAMKRNKGTDLNSCPHHWKCWLTSPRCGIDVGWGIFSQYM